ncbi:MAG: thiamine pyrophosphate-binding protein [Bacteroidota bacterium]
MGQRNVADYVLEQLEVWDIRTIYGLPGDAILPLIDAINRHPKMRFISVKHESAAALMASAEAKLTGGIGVCTATSGPGAANLLNGLADAKSDRAPVLAITGQVDSFNLGTNYKQYLDQNLLMASVADYSGLVAVPDSCNDVLVKALRKSLAEGAVAHVTFTKDVWQIPTEEAVRPPEPYLKTMAQSPPEVIAEAIKRLNEAQRPAILTGRGIRNLGPKLIEMAEKWQAGICTTLAAKGMIPGGHPLVLGGLGEGGSEASTVMLAESDLILVVGATWWPEKYVPGRARIIQLDATPDNIGRLMQVEYGVVGDLAVLLPEITRGISGTAKNSWFERLNSLRGQWLERIDQDISSDVTQISPGYLIKTLEKAVAQDAVIALDVGDHTVWFNRIFSGSAQETLISGSWRTMGFGLPAAISAKLAQPERQVIVLVGDGSLAMSLGEFLTAVRYQVPITVVVVNNGYLAMEKDKMEMKRMDPSQTAITNPDFAKLAEACGGKGFRVERSGDLEAVLKEAINSNQPALVDVITSPVKFPGLEEKKEPEKELALV